jgi:hypothetical protein
VTLASGAFAIVAVLAIAPAVAAKDLSFDERVRYQRAIEQVYWRHRIWPAENSTPKPALTQLMPEARSARRSRSI